MKFENLEDLINHILHKIMQDEYDRYLQMSFGDREILMLVFENEVPIRISYHVVYDDINSKPCKRIFAELCAELLKQDIGKGWLKELDEICQVIDENSHIFEKLIK